jgi:hypothetical protein
MRKLFKERKLIKGGNYMRKYGMYISYKSVSGPVRGNESEPSWLELKDIRFLQLIFSSQLEIEKWLKRSRNLDSRFFFVIFKV